MHRLIRAAALLSVSAAAVAGCARSQAPVAGGGSGGSDHCGGKLVSVVAIDAAGSPVPSPSAPPGHYARVYTYNVDGSDVRQVVPPSGWSPMTATATELAAYGFPPRPTTQPGLAHWQAIMRNWRQTIASGMCETNRTNR